MAAPLEGAMSEEVRVSTANPPLFDWSPSEQATAVAYSQDPSFPPAFPNFKDVRYWMQEYEALVGISEAIAGLG